MSWTYFDLFNFKIKGTSNGFVTISLADEVDGSEVFLDIPDAECARFFGELRKAINPIAIQYEKNKQSSRIKNGIAARRAKDPAWGRALSPDNKGSLGWRKPYDDGLVQKIHAKRANGLTYREIADDLEMSVNKVYRIMQRTK